VDYKCFRKTKTNLIGHCLSGDIGRSLFQTRSWIKCFEKSMLISNMHFQFLLKADISQATDHWPHTLLKISCTRWAKAVISWLFGIIWKQKILHKVKQILHIIKQNTIGIFFPVSVFVFFQIPQQPIIHTWQPSTENNCFYTSTTTNS
jgi:hypothetical protein